MTTKSPASRKSAERQRRKDAGEVRVECWISADEWTKVQEAAQFAEITTTDVIRQAIARL